MNEGDTAGGQRGRNQALPAGTDRREPNVNNAAQLPAGTQGPVTPMSRSFNENQQLEQQPQQPQQPPSSLHPPRQHQSQQMQSDGTPTPSSLSSASVSNKSFPQQQQQDHQQPCPATLNSSSSSSSSSNSNVNTATNVSSVQHPASSSSLSSEATSSHSLQQQQQQQQQQQGVSVRSGSGNRTTASDANNASFTSSAAAVERTGSATSSGSGTSRSECASGGSIVHTRSSGPSGAAGGAESAVSTPIVGGGGSCATTPAAAGSGAPNSGSVVLGNTLVKTNSTSTSSTATVAAAAAAAAVGGGQPTAISSFVATATGATSSSSPGSNTSSHKGSASPTASRKRAKLEPSADTENDSALKKLILEHKYMRLRSIKESYSEHVAELFFLQTGGSMMEYPVWRKKPPTPAFTNFIRSYKLEPLSTNLEEAGEALKQQSTRAIREPTIGGSTAIGNSISGNTSHHALSSGKGSRDSAASLPQGAEIKISGVGATPVAVSTTLPAAVAQLSQQGGTPIIPDRIGIVGAGTATTTSIDRKKHASVGVGSVTKSESVEAVGGSRGISGGGTSQGVPTIGSNGPSSLGSSSSSSSVRGGIGNHDHRGSGGVAAQSGATAAARLQGASLVNSVQQQNGTGYGNDGGSSGSASGNQQQQVGGDSSQSTSSNINGPDQYTNKARQEVFVMQRVQELQKEGLWTEKRLPKVQEPARPKAHWDYLLEEMVWLAADFAQERKWKKACARKCARMVQKHFQDKALAAQRAEKAQELQLKRIAAFVAKEIKTFWSNAEKLVEYKQQTKLDEKRKKALDQQLSFIVDQTEKYSQQLVEGMNKINVVTAAATTSGAPAGSKAESLNSSRISSPHRRALTGSDEEFCPEAESSDDDEETIAKAEAEAEEGTKDEVAALQKESEMDLDDFLKHLPKDYLANRDKIVLSEPDNDDDDEDDEDVGAAEGSKSVPKDGAASGEEEDGDKDFSADEDSMDDEDTIKEQERKEKHQDHKKELDELNADNEMSIEELIAKYKNPPPSSQQKMDLDSDDDEAEEEEEEVLDRRRRKTRRQLRAIESSASADEEDEEEDNSEGLTGSDDDLPTCSDEDELMDEDVAAMDTEEEEDSIGLKHLLDDETGASSSAMAAGSTAQDGATSSDKSQSAKDDMLNDAAAIAESIQPKGNTLSSTSVVTPIPILLKHSLREYQHIGLDWLVTMHDRKLNGILADEMGLGKTIQTISLLAHLACVKGNWGPHLIIVPSSVMLNWEMEFKKWCPGFKILTYYGTPKERKMKRTGWTKVNAFHVCITSYKLVIQDHQSFRRKKWKYLILDEAQNIKNFRSQRWQLLLNFQTEQRLLLTGTPLQNNLMELWSLMHFLMPHIFQSHREFKEWFSNPMTGMIEGNSEYSETIIKRLHKVLRPFLLRRLKSEVEKQMPKKYEHVIMCRLSKRQRFLYDDFMSRAKTRETLASGNLLSVINVLMQLRKVCNHPNMFEERPTISPFRMDGISFKTASLVYNMFIYDPFTQIDLSSLNLVLVQLELLLSAYVAHRSQRLCMPKRLIEEIDSTPLPPPRCPTGRLRLHVRIPDFRVQETLGGGRHRAAGIGSTGVRVGTSPAMKTEGTKFVPLVNDASSLDKKSSLISRLIDMRRSSSSSSSMLMMVDSSSGAVGGGLNSRSASPGILLRKRCDIVGSGGGVFSLQQQNQSRLGTGQVVQIIPQVAAQQQQGSGVNASASYIITGRLQSATASGAAGSGLQQRTTVSTAGGNVLSTLQRTIGGSGQPSLPAAATGTNRMVQSVGQQTQISSTLAATIMQQLKHHSYSSRSTTGGGSGGSKAAGSRGIITTTIDAEERQRTEFYLARIEESRKERRSQVLELLGRINAKRLDATPIYGRDLRQTLCEMIEQEFHQRFAERIPLGVASAFYTRRAMAPHAGVSLVASCSSLVAAIKTIEQRAEELRYTINNFVIFVPAVCAPTPYLQVSHPYPSKLNAERQLETTMAEQIRPAITLLHPIISAMSTQFPDPRLIQYDCGKLQTMDRLLKKLKSEGHRVLIFTQMTRMLDVLEAFLNYHGHIYLRLDGTTKVEQRQVLMERFNNDRRMFAFILSTRSGGVGINLTGADTVIFYDSDWNPTMDAQAQDRCHRIGQTRDVHIYRLVSEKTIEENILKKANQKRILGDLAIEGGNFTTAYFKSSTTVQDLFTVDTAEEDASARLAEVLERDRERKDRLNANLSATPSSASGSSVATTTDVDGSKSAINVFESALAAAEDDQDVQAAKFAKAEASAGFDDLDEIDENSPVDEEKSVAAVAGADSKQPELSKAEKEVQNLIKQLSPIERYAMRFVEDTEGTWTAVQLKAVEQEIEQQKRDWEANRLAEQRRNEEAARQREAEEHADLLTFSREDAKNQVNNKTHPSNRGSNGGGSGVGGRRKLRGLRPTRATRASAKSKTTAAATGGRNHSRGLAKSSMAKGDSGEVSKGGSSVRSAPIINRRRVVEGGRMARGSSGDRKLSNPSKVGAIGGGNHPASLLGKRKRAQNEVIVVGRRQPAALSRRNLRPAKSERNIVVAARRAKRNRTESLIDETDDEEEEEQTDEDNADEHTDDEDVTEEKREREKKEEENSPGHEDESYSDMEVESISTKETVDGVKKQHETAVSITGRNKIASNALNASPKPSSVPPSRALPRRASEATTLRALSKLRDTGSIKQQATNRPANNMKHSRSKILRRVQTSASSAGAHGSNSIVAADRSSVTAMTVGAASANTIGSDVRLTRDEPSAMMMRSVDEFDSECSLDVMIDSNDAPDSDSNQMNSYYTVNASAGGAVKEIDEEANASVDAPAATTPHATVDRQISRPTSRGGRSRDSRSKTPIAVGMSSQSKSDQGTPATGEGVEDGGKDSPATPRTTRSRGTVKINLWTLDDSPMLPVYKRTKTRTTTPQQANANHNDSDSKSLDEEDPLAIESSLEEDRRRPVDDGDVEHVKEVSTLKEEPPQSVSAFESGGEAKFSLLNLKVIVNDLKLSTGAQPVGRSVVAATGGRLGLSDGFRTPTPTMPKLRRMKRLSLGRAVSPGGGSNNRTARTLDSWLVGSKSNDTVNAGESAQNSARQPGRGEEKKGPLQNHHHQSASPDALPINNAEEGAVSGTNSNSVLEIHKQAVDRTMKPKPTTMHHAAKAATGDHHQQDATVENGQT